MATGMMIKTVAGIRIRKWCMLVNPGEFDGDQMRTSVVYVEGIVCVFHAGCRTVPSNSTVSGDFGTGGITDSVILTSLGRRPTLTDFTVRACGERP